MGSKMPVAIDSNTKLSSFLSSHPNIRTIITQWVDICGVARSRTTSIQRFIELVNAGGSFNGSVLDILSSSTGGLCDELLVHFADKRHRIVPDVSSIRVGFPLCETSAVVVGEVQGGEIEADARANLRRIVDEGAAKGYAFKIGFELEFVLLEKNELTPAAPGLTGVGSNSPWYRSNVWPLMEEVITALADAGILVEQVIKEMGPSQWEVALPPLPPVESVDAYMYARETIRNVAHKHNVVATFYPTPYVGDGQPSGEHIHVSATKGGDDGTSNTWNPDEMMAGILSHAPALAAIGLPQSDSYFRVGNGKMGAGGMVAWGENHRDVPVRRIGRNHWEVRVHDSTANAYAMVAGMIAAAMDLKALDIGGLTSKFPCAIEKCVLMMFRIHAILFRGGVEGAEYDEKVASFAGGGAEGSGR